MTASDDVIDALVGLCGQDCPAAIYREALMAFKRLVLAENLLACTMDMQRVEAALRGEFGE